MPGNPYALTALAAALLLAGCGGGRGGAPDESSPAGTLDPPSPPASTREADREALAAQVLDEGTPAESARKALGEAAAQMVAASAETSHFSGLEFRHFYTRGRSSGYPGLCQADEILVAGPGGGRSGLSTYSRFAVAGSLAPLPGPGNEAYGARLEAVCASRRDMRKWFRAPDAATASLVARAVERAVHGARSPGRLPFRLSCIRREIPDSPPCGDVRKPLAGLDPRAIAEAEVEPCGSPDPRRFCATVQIAIDPSYWDQKDLDSWELKVAGRSAAAGDAGSLRLDRVDLGQRHLIVE